MQSKTKLYIIFCLTFFIFNFNQSNSQSGISFPEFAEKLDGYFDKDMVKDVKNILPQNDFAVWSWDVGDYSGDNIKDLAFAVRQRGDKKNKLNVYFFVDIDGFLTLVGEEPYYYVELPLEVGVVIKKGSVFVTQKSKQFNWSIKSYKFFQGTFYTADNFSTEQIGKYTKETFTNFQTLTSKEKLMISNSGKNELSTEFFVIPSYSRGRNVYEGLNNQLNVNNVDYVNKGAYYWDGPSDCSFKLKSSYDKEYLYFIIEVTDDKIVEFCGDSCLADYVDLWLRLPFNEQLEKRLDINSFGKPELLKQKDSDLIKFSIYPGNFLEKRSYVEIGTNMQLSASQRLSAQSIKSVSNYIDKGYILKFKIPFSILNFDITSIKEDNQINFRASITVHDIDNVYRPEEESQISTSQLIENQPETFGDLLLIPNKKWYGEANNIYKDDVVKYLLEYGF